MTFSAVDVASYQAKNFSIPKGCGLAMIKATESNNYFSPNHDAQVAHARSSGLAVGHYHFQRAGSVSAQADYFLSKISPTWKAGDVIALDWEDAKVSDDDKNSWISYVEAKRPGVRVLLYCNKTFWKTRDKKSQCGAGLWIADPDSPAGHPDVQHAWTLHQYGISGSMDRDLVNFTDRAAWDAWALNRPKPPAPTPPKPNTPGGAMTEAQQIGSLYNDLMIVKRLDNGDQHAAGFFLATTLDTSQKALAAVNALTIKVQQIHDLLTQPEPAKADPAASEAAHFGLSQIEQED